MIPVLLKKFLVALVAVLTLGTVVPNLPASHVDKQLDKGSLQETETRTPAIGPYYKEEDQDDPKAEESPWKKAIRENGSKDRLIDAFSVYAASEAKDQGLYKFGSRVSAQIGDQYVREIAPAFAAAIRDVSWQHDKNWVRSLAVTHSPSAGRGERILHVYQTDTGQDVLKLHVRRDHPPLDGYWFDFHYHTALDGFEKHHELKKIYWGKNIPPRWRA
ncbi:MULTISPECIES: YpjP family protein [unclassified Sporolactobacillus]|uniref:YpjP family protein n=1 Tax=unclassified Sporolactobacillus TaxID=2628533 RepID=UPI0023689A78|nr:YpjP family protein [Sporolactobacillus sp. CQH2019]MDD9147410.1 YpjP family protein [Sporolactobacillus sp. CQH2019]